MARRYPAAEDRFFAASLSGLVPLGSVVIALVVVLRDVVWLSTTASAVVRCGIVVVTAVVVGLTVAFGGVSAVMTVVRRDVVCLSKTASAVGRGGVVVVMAVVFAITVVFGSVFVVMPVVLRSVVTVLAVVL